MMKKLIAAMLTLSMMLTLGVASAKQEEQEEVQGNQEIEFKVGTIDEVYDTASLFAHAEKEHPDEYALWGLDWVYPNLSTALLALDKGELHMLAVCESTAEYVAAHNDEYAAEYWGLNPEYKANRFAMLTTDQNTELNGILNGAITELKANGTLDKLIADELTACIESDPAPAALPKFDGAKTYKIAVTGDLPPMDFVTADGKAAGFNVALLTEIANIAQVNFELVQVDSGARLIALASGKVDAVFWMISHCCPYCGEFIDFVPKGTLMTDHYFSDHVKVIFLKENLVEQE